MKTIKELPQHSRPREKLKEKGPAALTDEELVAAILGMGTAGVDVRTISKQVAALIREHQAELSLDHLLQVPGIGLAKAAQILRARSSRMPLPTGLLPLSLCITIHQGTRSPAELTAAHTSN